MKLKVGIIIFLVIVESCSLFLMYKSSHNKPQKPLEDVKINEETTTFIYMLEQNFGSKDYLETNVTSWPILNYHYNEVESKCLDFNNEIVNDAIEYDEESMLVTLEKENAVKCYLYYDKN